MTAPRAKPASDVSLFYVDDVGVLFSEARQELHLLNPMATLIWSLLEEDHDEAAMAAILREAQDIDTRRAADFVRSALDDWHTKGFLHGDDDVACQARAPEVKPTSATLEALATHATRRYALLSSRIVVRFSSDAQIAVVAAVLAHLATTMHEQAPTSSIDIIEKGTCLHVYRDLRFLARCDALDALAPIVKSAVWGAVLDDAAYFLDIHAGVVSDGERCLVLPGPPGSGKSTLTAALVHAGFEFFSDEIALLEDTTLDVLPVPLALCVKDSGIDALADRYPMLRSLQVHRRGDGKRVVYLPPPSASMPATHAARPVGALVFPRFVRGAATSLVALPRAEALQALMSQCLRVAEPLTATRVERLVQWIVRIRCYSLQFGATDEAVATMVRLLGRATRTAVINTARKAMTERRISLRRHRC